jgi:predicted nuclease of predicted toxin-antitoxin system
VKILVDMNLPPAWTETLAQAGLEAVHWSAIGDGRALDSEIMAWALVNDFIVFTHDLDFGALLAANRGHRPSVIQIRGQDVTSSAVGRGVINAITQFQAELMNGALVTVDAEKARVRVLPL